MKLTFVENGKKHSTMLNEKIVDKQEMVSARKMLTPVLLQLDHAVHEIRKELECMR